MQLSKTCAVVSKLLGMHVDRIALPRAANEGADRRSDAADGISDERVSVVSADDVPDASRNVVTVEFEPHKISNSNRNPHRSPDASGNRFPDDEGDDGFPHALPVTIPVETSYARSVGRKQIPDDESFHGANETVRSARL